MKLVTIGLITVIGIAVAAPALAEDVFVGGRVGGVGVGVDVGGPGYYHDGYRHYNRGDRVYRTEGFDRHEGVERCRTTIIRRDDGSTRKIQRCRD
jgi:hypothetical protein